ncbi:MAG: sulfatase-like hydrolase/transferase [Bacteroidia bacterium]|nr:sulfatase-like hydrolase/transferase [Bacteroidia bacterium]
MTTKYTKQTIVAILILFVLCAFPIILSFILKNLNPAEYGLIQGNKQDFELTYKELLFFTSIVLCFFFFSAGFRYAKSRVTKIGIILIPLLYLTSAFLFLLTDILYYIVFAYRMTFSVVQTILNTNSEEAKDFVSIYASWGVILLLLVVATLLILLYVKRKAFFDLIASKPFFIGSCLVSIFGVLDYTILSIQNENQFMNVRYWDITIGQYKAYNDFINKLEADKNTVTLSGEYKNFNNKDSIPKTLVLVISESLSKNHMSLYGYGRKTTPNLDSNNSIIKFYDCVAYAALTIDAVPSLVYNNFQTKEINLIALLNKLNYETTWISNQSGWGRKDGPIVLMSKLCQRSIYNDSLAENDQANSSHHYDAEILDSYQKILSSESKKSKFIVLHLMGCHFEYERRYPLGWNKFIGKAPIKLSVNNKKTEDIVNAYDNAVLYHDSVTNEIIKKFKNYTKDKNAALIFLSDHGEEIYEKKDYFGHCYPPTKIMSEIPYFTLLSPEFRKRYSAIDSVMHKRTMTRYSTGKNFFTVLYLLNIGSEKHNPEIERYGFFSPNYDSTYTRHVMGDDYDKMK